MKAKSTTYSSGLTNQVRAEEILQLRQSDPARGEAMLVALVKAASGKGASPQAQEELARLKQMLDESLHATRQGLDAIKAVLFRTIH